MRIAICDDNLDYITTIEGYIDELNLPEVEYDVFTRGEELVEAYKEEEANYDALFLDMEMGNLDGIETANLIRSFDRQVIIVFVTSYKQYMQKSFQCMPFRFLLKPVSLEEFKKTFKEVMKKIDDFPETVIFLEKKKRTRLYCSDIVFFESSSHWILIHTTEGKIHKMRKSMSELLSIIEKSTFLRVHRAFAVNLSHIHQIAEKEIMMNYCTKSIPLSKTYKNKLNEEFLNFKERKYLL